MGDSGSSFSAEDNALFGNFEENDPEPHQNVLSASAASVSPHKWVSPNSAVFIYFLFNFIFLVHSRAYSLALEAQLP